MRLLLVTHNPAADEELKNKLSNHYLVDVASTCETALYKFEVSDYALVILDLQLPDGSGLDLCKRWRTEFDSAVPILFLTYAKSQETIITALNLGADDFISKPCQFPELFARIKCLLRRQSLLKPICLRHENLLLDIGSYQASYGTEPIKFRKKEWLILELLIRNQGQVIPYFRLWEHAWECSEEIKSNVIEVHLSRIRKKLAKYFSDSPIETVKPIGYRWIKNFTSSVLTQPPMASDQTHLQPDNHDSKPLNQE